MYEVKYVFYNNASVYNGWEDVFIRHRKSCFFFLAVPFHYCNYILECFEVISVEFFNRTSQKFVFLSLIPLLLYFVVSFSLRFVLSSFLTFDFDMLSLQKPDLKLKMSPWLDVAEHPFNGIREHEFYHLSPFTLRKFSTIAHANTFFCFFSLFFCQNFQQVKPCRIHAYGFIPYANIICK